MRNKLAILALVILTASSTFAAKEYKPKPIPAGPKAFTEKQYREQCLKCYQRNIIGDYKKLSKRDPAWDEKALKVLEDLSEYLSDISKHDVAFEAKELIDAGCDDPMVQAAFGITGYGYRNQSLESLKRAVDAFEKGKYHKFLPHLAAQNLMFFGQDKEKQKHYQDLDRDWLFESLRDKSFLPGEERIALSAFPSQEGGTIGSYLPNLGSEEYLPLIEKCKGIDPYVRKVADGRWHLMKGWGYRGGGWASDVTDDGWKGFSKEVKIARKLFNEAYKLHPNYPEACDGMIEVAAIDQSQIPGETSRMWFDRAVAAQLDYTSAYYDYFLFNQQRWGGTSQELYDFSVACLKTGRFDTEVPWWFFEGLREYVTNSTDGDSSYWTKPETAKYLKVFFEGYEKTGFEHKPNYYKTMHAAVCAFCGRFSDARQILIELGDNADPYPFTKYYGLDFRDAKRTIMAYGGPLGPDIIKADKFAAEDKSDEARAGYEQAANQIEKDPLAKDYIDLSLAQLIAVDNLLKGGWVDIKPPSNFCAYKINGGNWTANADGTIVGYPTNGFELMYAIGLGARYEVQVDIDFVGEQQPGVGAGFTLEEGIKSQSALVYVYYSKADNKVIVMNESHYEMASANVEDSGDHAKLDIKVYGKKLMVSLNDKVVIPSVKLDSIANGRLRCVGLGCEMPQQYGFNSPEGHYPVFAKYSNWKVQLLKDDPIGK